MSIVKMLARKVRSALGTQQIIDLLRKYPEEVTGALGEIEKKTAPAPAEGFNVETSESLIRDSAEQLLHLLENHTAAETPACEYPPWYNLSSLDQALLKLLHNLAPERTIRLDYPPSYDYSPRWGYRTPPHQGLIDLFARHRDDYRCTFDKLARLGPWFAKINKVFTPGNGGEPAWHGGPINAIDCALLYGFVADLQPKTYLEIGSGITTLFAARAKRDHGLKTRIVSFDPNPRTAVDAVCDHVIRKGLEVADTDIFDTLEPGDIVFMDGSHRSFMNSDVTVFMLDILPKLKPGIVIHFHDITWPSDYPPNFAPMYWNEQYILAAYLLGAADRIRILLPSCYAAKDPELQKHLTPLLAMNLAPVESWHYGGSLWFTHTR
jgi:predicted O-methyltransferase YrrM